MIKCGLPRNLKFRLTFKNSINKIHNINRTNGNQMIPKDAENVIKVNIHY